ncbi:MAG: cytochrome b/b6 domain-containing protein [Eggerthellaceae bacterium]|nr:cytochrome b/b6 domain-containing protein [Eggerthellaceae bacterium]
MPGRYIKRHSLQTRLTHGIVVFSVIWLAISGLFVFVPYFTQIGSGEFVRFMRVSHRVVGVIFILVPIVSALLAPGGFKAFLKKYFVKWTPEDKEFMKKFIPYMLSPKKVHMPDQDEVKSGQRVADGAIIVGGIMMAVSGLALWLGGSVFHASAEVLVVMRFVHDLFFLVLVVFVVAHAYLGAGIFQPYHGMRKLMFGDGLVRESDALYHWGFWAREELEEGDNIVER